MSPHLGCDPFFQISSNSAFMNQPIVYSSVMDSVLNYSYNKRIPSPRRRFVDLDRSLRYLRVQESAASLYSEVTDFCHSVTQFFSNIPLTIVLSSMGAQIPGARSLGRLNFFLLAPNICGS
jgi:hypothetical protein